MHLDFSPLFKPLEKPFYTIVIAMLATGLIAGLLARMLFFWAPRKIRGEISGTVGALGLLFGGWIAFKVLHP